VVFDEVCERHLRYSPTSMGEEDLEEDEVREAVEAPILKSALYSDFYI